MPYQLFCAGFSSFHQSQSHSVLLLALRIFPFLFCLFFDMMTLPHTFSCLLVPFQLELQFLVLGEKWDIQILFISKAILRHRVPHGQFVTMWNARRCPWGWPLVIALPDTWRERSWKLREAEGEGEKSRRRMNLTKALKQICPTQQSQGSMHPGCQHLSLVKGSLPDNVTLITESPDSDFLPFSYSCKQCQLKLHAHVHSPSHTHNVLLQSTLFPPQSAWSAFHFI